VKYLENIFPFNIVFHVRSPIHICAHKSVAEKAAEESVAEKAANFQIETIDLHIKWGGGGLNIFPLKSSLS